MMMMMILMRFYEQIFFFFYVDFSSFFLSFTTKLRYDPNTFTPNNIIFSPSPCLCLGGGGAGLAHASVTTFSSVFLFSLFCPLFLLSLSLFFLDVYVIWFDDNK